MPNKFIVSLKENTDDKFTATHECIAIDQDDAESQAIDAYPFYVVINVTDMGRVFYKRVISFEILSEEPIEDMTLSETEYEVVDGHMSGMFLDSVDTVLIGSEMARALSRQGTDPSFFSIDEHGNDIDD